MSVHDFRFRNDFYVLGSIMGTILSAVTAVQFEEILINADAKHMLLHKKVGYQDCYFSTTIYNSLSLTHSSYKMKNLGYGSFSKHYLKSAISILLHLKLFVL